MSLEELLYAKLIRFYGVGQSALWPMQTPHWVLEILVQAVDVLMVEELQQATSAASAPHMERAEKRSFWSKINSVLRPFQSSQQRTQRERAQVRDPDKAARYLEMMGVKVVNTDDKR